MLYALTPFRAPNAVTRSALLVVLFLVCIPTMGCGGDLQQKPPIAVVNAQVRFSYQHRRMAPFRFFSSSSYWNQSLPADAPLDPSSAAMMGAFDEEIAAEESVKSGPWINATYYSVPIYTVPASQPVVKVTLEDSSKSPALQSAWDAVPLPANAQPAAGIDKHVVVWQPSTDRLWEFWHLEMTAAGWKAGW